MLHSNIASLMQFFFGIDLLSSSFAILSIRDELFQCSPKVFIGANEIVCYRYDLDVNFPVNIMPNQGTEKTHSK